MSASLVQETYGAFGRGDIPAVLGAFTADIEWNVPAVLPHGAKARGQEEVGRFFQVLASKWENFDLQLDNFVASGDRVCAFGSAHGTFPRQAHRLRLRARLDGCATAPLLVWTNTSTRSPSCTQG